MNLTQDHDAMCSSGIGQLPEIIGEGHRFIPKVGYFLVIPFGIALTVYQFKKCIKEDKEYGSRRRIVRQVVDIMIHMLALSCGSYIGVVIGCMTGIRIFSTIGWVIGGVLANKVCNEALDTILDYFKIDIKSVDCENCGEKFECRRYEVGDQKECAKCRNKKID